MIYKALTIAGSDSSGGAGIQADLKTFSRLKVYGMSVITALTAQNTTGVTGIFNVSPDFVAKQFDAVMTDIPPDAAKTGMLSNVSVVEAVAEKVRQYGLKKLVVDPVMISKSGAPLLRRDAVEALKGSLLPLALLLTPNIDEAQALTGLRVSTVADMEEAARLLFAMGPANVLVKGGHLKGQAVDVFFDGADIQKFSSPRIETNDSHGTGCVLSAAITAHLAKGVSLVQAIGAARELIGEAIRNGLRIGEGIGPCDPLALALTTE